MKGFLETQSMEELRSSTKKSITVQILGFEFVPEKLLITLVSSILRQDSPYLTVLKVDVGVRVEVV